MQAGGATGGYFHETDWDINQRGIVQWSAGNGTFASYWKVIDIDNQGVYTSSLTKATANSKTYASAYLPFSYTVSGAKAYTAKVDNANSELTLTEVATVPAFTGVVIIGDADATSYTANFAATDATVDNDLSGVTFSTAMNGTNYYLGLNEGTPGFYKTTLTNNITNKAYLDASKLTDAASAKGYKLVIGEGETTGINSVENAKVADNAPRYNLAGQRVSKNYKGVVVAGGKKFLQK